MKNRLKELQNLNWEILKNPCKYLFTAKCHNKKFMVTNLSMSSIRLPTNYHYNYDKDVFEIIMDGVLYEFITREELWIL